MNLGNLTTYFKVNLFTRNIIDFAENNRYGDTPLNYALKCNIDRDLNLTEAQFNYIFKKSDLKQVNIYGEQPITYALLNNKKQNLNLTNEHFDYLIHNSDLNRIGDYEWTPLMIVLLFNKKENLNFSKEHFDYLLKNSDLKIVNKEGVSTLMIAMKSNMKESLNFNKEHWDYLIKNSDLKQVDKYGFSTLKYALNNIENLNLNNEQWKYLIENSDLSLIKDEKQLIELNKIKLKIYSSVELSIEQVDYLASVDVKLERKIQLDTTAVEKYLERDLMGTMFDIRKSAIELSIEKKEYENILSKKESFENLKQYLKENKIDTSPFLNTLIKIDVEKLSHINKDDIVMLLDNADKYKLNASEKVFLLMFDNQVSKKRII